MSSLSEVVDQLKHNREASEDTTIAIEELNQSIQGYIEGIGRESFGEAEQAYESGRGLPATKTDASGTSKTGKRGGLLGRMFGPLFSLFSLTGPFAGILAPITRLAALFATGLRAVPLLGAIFLIYDIFKDIGENENFKATMDSIKTTWNEKILPIFDKIKQTLTDIGDNKNFSETFDKIKQFFIDFKTNVQDVALGTLDIFVTTIGDILTGVDELLNGEFLTGFKTIATSLFEGVVNLADLLFTNILETFGVDFGPDGTLFGFIGRKIEELTMDMKLKWVQFKDYVSGAWSDFTEDLKNLWLYFTDPNTEGSIPATFIKIKDDTIAKGVEIYTSIMGKVNGLIDAIVSIIPSKEDIGNYFRNILPESWLDFFGLSGPLSSRLDAKGMTTGGAVATGSLSDYANVNQQQMLDIAQAGSTDTGYKTYYSQLIPKNNAASIEAVRLGPNASMLPPMIDASQQTNVNNVQSTKVQLSNSFPAATDNNWMLQYMGAGQ